MEWCARGLAILFWTGEAVTKAVCIKLICQSNVICTARSLRYRYIRMFNVKCSPNYYTWIPSCTAQNQCQYWSTAADALLEIGATIIPAVLSLDEHLLQTNISCVPKCCCQLVYYSYLILRIMMCIAKWYTNSSRQFRSEVVFDTKHVLLVSTPYSHLHSFGTPCMGMGLVTRVTFTQGPWGELVDYYSGSWVASDFIFVP